jgi:hypothetical protein
VVSFGSAAFTGWQANENRKMRMLSQELGLRQASDSANSADFARRSAMAAEESARAAREGTVISQRAWVTISSVQIVHSDSRTGIPLLVKVAGQNGGPSPATAVQIEAYLQAQAEFTPRYSPQTPSKNIGIVGPGGGFSVDMGLECDDSERAEFGRGIKRFYLYGQLTYTDILGNRHGCSFGYENGRNSGVFLATAVHNTIIDYASTSSDEN